MKYRLINCGMNGSVKYIVASSEEDAQQQAERLHRDPEYRLERLPDDFPLVAHAQSPFMRLLTDGEGDEILARR